MAIAPPNTTSIEADLPSQLRFAVMRLARRLRQQQDTDATVSQLSALASIDHLGPITLGDLAAFERVAPPSMTRIVNHLEEHGLVRREVDSADRRVARVSATSTGRKLLNDSRRRKTAYLAARVAHLSPEERETLNA